MRGGGEERRRRGVTRAKGKERDVGTEVAVAKPRKESGRREWVSGAGRPINRIVFSLRFQGRSSARPYGRALRRRRCRRRGV